MEEETRQAKVLAKAGKKREAVMRLKKRKMFEKELVKLEGKHFMLE